MLYQEMIAEASVIADERSLIESAWKFARWTGFESFGIVAITDLPDGSIRFNGVDVVPEKYRQLYQDFSRGRSDPVMQHCKRHHTPVIWDQAFYHDVGMVERWEENAACGLAAGVALAYHLPDWRHVFVGFTRSAPKFDGRECEELVGRVQMFGASVIEPALAVLADRGGGREVQLTPQEIEYLKWATEGKTAYETSVIVGLSHSRVTKVLSSALRKLDCLNKQQAVVKALRLKLLSASLRRPSSAHVATGLALPAPAKSEHAVDHDESSPDRQLQFNCPGSLPIDETRGAAR